MVIWSRDEKVKVDKSNQIGRRGTQYLLTDQICRMWKKSEECLSAFYSVFVLFFSSEHYRIAISETGMTAAGGGIVILAAQFWTLSLKWLLDTQDIVHLDNMKLRLYGGCLDSKEKREI